MLSFRPRLRLAGAVAAVSLVLAGVAIATAVVRGPSDPEPQARVVAAPSESSAARPDHTVPDHGGDPNDILTLTNVGTTTYVMGFDSYRQKRDYSDTVVVATLDTFDVERPKPDEMLSGRLVARMRVDHVVGGRHEPILVDGLVEVIFKLDGDEAVTERVLERIEPMLGEAQYLLFLGRALPGPDGEARYVASIDDGPNGILAVWPGDGRLSPVMPRNDLALPAIERGEKLTGRPSEEVEPAEPVFEGVAPVGLTIAEVMEGFARPVGTVESEPPNGWAEYQKILAELLAE